MLPCTIDINSALNPPLHPLTRGLAHETRPLYTLRHMNVSGARFLGLDHSGRIAESRSSPFNLFVLRLLFPCTATINMRGLGSLFALGATFLTMDTVLAAPATSNVGVALPPVHPIADYLPSNLTAEINDDLTFLGKTDAEIAAFHKSMSLSALEAAFVPSGEPGVRERKRVLGLTRSSQQRALWPNRRSGSICTFACTSLANKKTRATMAGQPLRTFNVGLPLFAGALDAPRSLLGKSCDPWLTTAVSGAIYKLNVDFKSAETGNARIRFRLGSGTGVNQAIYYRSVFEQRMGEAVLLLLTV